MNTNLPLSLQEQVVFSLRALYSRFGYNRYIMSKFEPYDLYAGNKDFLISDNVITFTDLGGQLMALKPDVTLSIVKNTKDTDSLQKLYYNENVYRVAAGSNGFREIMQVGLECLGNIDNYCVSEVLLLAAKSLQQISDTYILSVSDLGLLTQVLDAVGLSRGQKTEALRCIGQKNTHELQQLCASWGMVSADIDLLRQLVSVSGPVQEALPRVEKLLRGKVQPDSLGRFVDVLSALSQTVSGVCVDFSVVDNIHYYTGFVFKGFVAGVPESVLSGGEYNRLMQKMGRRNGAIGFAVYMNMLQQLESPMEEYDADILLLSGNADPGKVLARAQELSKEGRVLVCSTQPENLRVKRTETVG